jgi:8-oxo-dGTP pyrophosphatase MutT (NUDIX family)
MDVDGHMGNYQLRQRGTAVATRDEKVLLARDRRMRCFSLPGGGIKKGEPTASAAARELYEELGLNAIKVKSLPRMRFQRLSK